jgi:hypothetical protein
MRMYIVQDAAGNLVATLPADEISTSLPGTEDRVTVQIRPLLIPGQQSAAVELPPELESLPPADRHEALTDYELLRGQATLLPRSE